MKKPAKIVAPTSKQDPRSAQAIAESFEQLRDSPRSLNADGSENTVALYEFAVDEAVALAECSDVATESAHATRLHAMVRILAGERLPDPALVLSNGWTEAHSWQWAIEQLAALLTGKPSKATGAIAARGWQVLLSVSPDSALKLYPEPCVLAAPGVVVECAMMALSVVLERNDFVLVPTIAEQLAKVATAKSTSALVRAECTETLTRICLGSSQPEQALQWAVMSVQVERKLGRMPKLVEALGALSECYLRNDSQANALSAATERVRVAQVLHRENPDDEFAEIRLADAQQALAWLHSLHRPKRGKA